jgi:zinc protease
MANERFEEIAREPNAPFSGLGGDIGGYTRTMDVLAFSAEPISGKEKEARERTLKEVELLKRFGFTQSELERAKLSLMSGLETAYKDRENTKNKSFVSEYARNFLNAESIPGIEWEYAFTMSALQEIKLEAVNALVNDYLNRKSLFYFVYAPDKEGLVLPTEAQLKEELAATASLKLEPRKETLSNKTLIEKKIKPGKVKKAVSNPTLGTTEWTLSNGIKVILKPTPYNQSGQ